MQMEKCNRHNELRIFEINPIENVWAVIKVIIEENNIFTVNQLFGQQLSQFETLPVTFSDNSVS